MAIVENIIRLEEDNTLSFGNYRTDIKQKADSFEVDGDLYKVKTHRALTRLEKNGKLLFEAVPGASVFHLNIGENALSFDVAGIGLGETQITMELEPAQAYKLHIDATEVGDMQSNILGKINFSIALTEVTQAVRIEKI